MASLAALASADARHQTPDTTLQVAVAKSPRRKPGATFDGKPPTSIDARWRLVSGVASKSEQNCFRRATPAVRLG